MIGDGRRAEIRLSDLLYYLIEQVGIAQLSDELAELEMFKNLPGILGKPLDLGFQVIFEGCLTKHGEIHLGDITKGEAAGDPQQHLFLGIFRQIHGLDLVILGQNRFFACLQHPFQTAKEGKGQDNTAILRLFKITA